MQHMDAVRMDFSKEVIGNEDGSFIPAPRRMSA